MTVLIFTPNTYTSWIKMMDNNVHVPINFILWRPFIKFEMFNVVVMQSGLQTGANMLGKSSMCFDNSAADKMMLGHYTFWHASVVFNHRRIEILENVFPKRYLGGWDTQWITSASALHQTSGGGSLIVTPIPVTEEVGEVSIDLLDTSVPRLLPTVVNRPRGTRERASYSSASMTQRLWQLAQGDLSKATVFIGADGRYTGALVNQRSRRGKHYKFNPLTKAYTSLDGGCSALSDDRTGVGARPIWTGTMRVLLPVQREVMQGIVIS
jgi:hypothetical protein